MGLKGSGTYFQRCMSNTVLTGRVYQICELYIDDVLIHGRDFVPFLHNVRKVFERTGSRPGENKARNSGKKMLWHIFCGETVRGPTGLQTVHPPDTPQEPDVSTVTLTRKVLRWKVYLQDKDFYLCHDPGGGSVNQ